MRNVPVCLIVSCAALFALAAPAAGTQRTRSPAIPDNARPRSYGSGWDCNRGFRETAGRCAVVVVPANAYLSPEGSSWTCDRGFRPEGAACAAVNVPVNAYAVDTRYDRGWRCNRGYREVAGRCQQPAVPAHAYAVDCELRLRMGMRARLPRGAGRVRRGRSSGQRLSGSRWRRLEVRTRLPPRRRALRFHRRSRQCVSRRPGQ